MDSVQPTPPEGEEGKKMACGLAAEFGIEQQPTTRAKTPVLQAQGKVGNAFRAQAGRAPGGQDEPGACQLPQLPRHFLSSALPLSSPSRRAP